MGRLGSTGTGRKTPGVSKQISGKHWLPGYEAHGTMSRGGGLVRRWEGDRIWGFGFIILSDVLVLSIT